MRRKLPDRRKPLKRPRGALFRAIIAGLVSTGMAHKQGGRNSRASPTNEKLTPVIGWASPMVPNLHSNPIHVAAPLCVRGKEKSCLLIC
jgi:hypothetical protein